MKKILGIELGSTRIKSVLIDETGKPLASGTYAWENKLVGGYWSYDPDEIVKGIQASYSELVKDLGQTITSLDGLGISAMMHGYLALDKNDKPLVPFRTWRNTTTSHAAKELTELFGFNIPQRWSVAHYYQAVLNNESHVAEVKSLTTLAGYVHFLLTGKKVLGIGDASGMFPIKNVEYNKDYLVKFNGLLSDNNVNVDFETLLPEILLAGEDAGILTEKGSKILDITGTLRSGAIACPPEGDAGTGMVATNSITPETANVSAGTSAFLMAVLKKGLSRYYEEIDMVTTPCGDPVAMVHVNNCTNEINAWVKLFDEVIKLFGCDTDKEDLYTRLFKCADESDCDCGKLIGYNFLSGEPIVGISDGKLMFVRESDGKLNLANFMQMQLFSALGALSLGMEILYGENVRLKKVCGHGGFFKTEKIGAVAMSAAIKAPVTVMKNAGEGGAWGIALLALYRLKNEKTLADFLNEIFTDCPKTTVTADEIQIKKFTAFMQRYKNLLAVERAAVEL